MTYTKELSELLYFDYDEGSDLAMCNKISLHIIPLKLATPKYRKWLATCDTPRLFLFEDEWLTKRNIALSMIANKMGNTPYKIYARKCTIQKIPQKVAKIFLNNNHIAGHVQAQYAYGLYYEKKLVSVMTFRKPFIKKYSNAIEIARFASVINHNVIGGLSKLLTHATKAFCDEYSHILTYGDRKFGQNLGYATIGFNHIDITDQDYFYTDGKKRYNRFRFRATPFKSEKEVALQYNVFRVYGCGSNIFMRDI